MPARELTYSGPARESATMIAALAMRSPFHHRSLCDLAKRRILVSQQIRDFSGGPPFAIDRCMSRRRRIQFPGGVYHVMTRGNRKGPIYENEDDRLHFLKTIATATERYRIRIYEFCLMGNHYHLLLDTPRGNLSDAMCYINGVFAQSSNWRHVRTGHLFGERFTSLVVPRELYLKRAARYIVLNPVEAGLVRHPAEQLSRERRHRGRACIPVSRVAALGLRHNSRSGSRTHILRIHQTRNDRSRVGHRG